MVLVARTRAALDTLAAQIEGEGGEAAVECCDMANTEQVRPHTESYHRDNVTTRAANKRSR